MLARKQALQAARSFQPLSQAQVAELAKTATVAKGGRYELYKTSHHFDGTYQNLVVFQKWRW